MKNILPTHCLMAPVPEPILEPSDIEEGAAPLVHCALAAQWKNDDHNCASIAALSMTDHTRAIFPSRNA
jgi:hypothetical protein